MSSLISLVYASVATHDFGSTELAELLKQSRAANELYGLTGMLLYSDRSFFQVVEGEIPEVGELYRKLLMDNRHSKITLISQQAISKRAFGDWSMGFANPSPEDLAEIDGLNDFFQERSCFTQLDNSRAKKLLAAFSDGRWRTKLSGPAQQGA